MNIITCAKPGCGKQYKGESFKKIEKDNNLLKKGYYYFCPGCSKLADEIKAESMTIKNKRRTEEKKPVIGGKDVI